MATVRRWTGREARALRAALRYSVRGFAEYLGVGVRTVATWEASGDRIVPRPIMQSTLDRQLLVSHLDGLGERWTSPSEHSTWCKCGR